MRALASGFAALVLCCGLAVAQDNPISDDPAKVKSGRYILDSDHGKITWSVSHGGLSTYIGQFAGVEAELDLDTADPAKSRLTATVKTASAGTFHDGLDAHLKTADFLDVEKFPAARFTATRIEPTGPKTARVSGDLTLLAATKPFSFDVTFNAVGLHPVAKAMVVGFTGRGVLKRSDWGMGAYIPFIGDDVTLEMEGEFRPAG